MIAALLGHPGLMPLRVEGHAQGVYDLDTALVEGAVQLPQRRLCALQEGRPGGCRPRIDSGFQCVTDRDQFLRKAFDGELAGILHLALAELAEILQFRAGAQVAVAVLGGPGFGRGQCVQAVRRSGVRWSPALGMIGFVHSCTPLKKFWRLKVPLDLTSLGAICGRSRPNLRVWRSNPRWE